MYVVSGRDVEGRESASFADAVKRLEEVKLAQRPTWEAADAVVAGQSQHHLKQMLQKNLTLEVSALHDRVGQNLFQVAALHDRGDVILWLQREHQMGVRAVNRERLSVLQLCRRAGSLGAAKMVTDAIGGDTVRGFCYRHFHRRRALRAARAAFQLRVKVQSRVRGWIVRNKYAPLLHGWNAFMGK